MKLTWRAMLQRSNLRARGYTDDQLVLEVSHNHIIKVTHKDEPPKLVLKSEDNE